MTTYWLSYRIADHGAAASTYERRYEGFHIALYALADANKVWSETTSFAVFESDLDTRDIGHLLRAPLMADHDVFLLRKMESKSAVIFGASTDRKIFQMMPYLARIT